MRQFDEELDQITAALRADADVLKIRCNGLTLMLPNDPFGFLE